MAFLDNMFGNKQQPESIEEEIDREDAIARDNRGHNTEYQPQEDIQLTDEQMYRLKQSLRRKPVEEDINKEIDDEDKQVAAIRNQQTNPQPPPKLNKYKEELITKIKNIDGKKLKEKAIAAGVSGYRGVSKLANEIAAENKKQSSVDKTQKLTAREEGRKAAMQQAPPQPSSPPRRPRQSSAFDSGIYTGGMSSQSTSNNQSAGSNRAYDSGMYTQRKTGTPSLPMQGKAYDSGWYTGKRNAPSAPDNRSAMNILFGDRMNMRPRAQAAPDNRSAVSILFGNQMQRTSSIQQNNSQRGSTHLGGLSVLHAASTGQFKAGYGGVKKSIKPTNPSKINKVKQK